jgi:hypothetical protein
MCTIFLELKRYFILIPVYINCNFDFFEFHEFEHEIQNFDFKISPIIYHFQDMCIISFELLP